jgi:uncharacterized membrane protein
MNSLHEQEKTNFVISLILKGGLLLAILFGFIGGSLFLWHHGSEMPNYSIFKVESSIPGKASGIFDESNDKSWEIMQIGIWLLIATPVARVASCAVIFFRQRDLLYFAVACIVLLILFYSLFWNAASPSQDLLVEKK